MWTLRVMSCQAGCDVDAGKTVTLKGDSIAEDFQKIVDGYVRERYNSRLKMMTMWRGLIC